MLIGGCLAAKMLFSFIFIEIIVLLFFATRFIVKQDYKVSEKNIKVATAVLIYLIPTYWIILRLPILPFQWYKVYIMFIEKYGLFIYYY
jgi:hypothetical protein